MAEYIRCHDCAFWVTPDDEYCPNCHTVIPYRSISQASSDGAVVGGGIFGVIAFLFCCVRFARDPLYSSNFIFGLFALAISAFGGLASMILGVYIGKIIGGSVGVANKTITFAKLLLASSNFSRTSSLKESEKTIRKRLSELQAYKQQLEETWSDVVKRKSTKGLQLSTQVLYSATESLQREYRKYEIRLWRVELLRWQNALEPLLLPAKVLTYEDLRKHILNLQDKEENGKSILKKWDEQKSLITITEGIIVASHLKRMLEILETQIEKLLVEQTKLAVKNISPVEIAFSYPSIPLDQLDLLNSRYAVGEFSSDLKLLEDEYFRLKSEDEAIKEVQELLNEA